MATFPRIPINPRLIFGESIEKVCTRGRLHPGLKELFTKAYFSAHQNECLIYEDGTAEENKSSPGAWILTILKFGQGDVAVRLSLKRRVETGRWIMPLQVPPAAPLWLIRHFLGRLRNPLIFCLADGTSEIVAFKRRWFLLSKDCHTAMYQHAFNQKIHHPIQLKIAQAMDEMQLEACLTLISLITLIRNLSYEPVKGYIDRNAVKALIDYFVPALISRPYRPGYLTKEDKGVRSALCYLCHNLPDIQAHSKRPATCNDVHLIFDSSTGASILDFYKKRETSPAVKEAISKVLKASASKKDGHDPETFQQATHPESKIQCTPKNLNKNCQKEEQGKCRGPHSTTLMETQHGKEDKETLTDFILVNGNCEKNQVSTGIKSDIPSTALLGNKGGKEDKETLTDFQYIPSTVLLGSKGGKEDKETLTDFQLINGSTEKNQGSSRIKPYALSTTLMKNKIEKDDEETLIDFQLLDGNSEKNHASSSLKFYVPHTTFPKNKYGKEDEEMLTDFFLTSLKYDAPSTLLENKGKLETKRISNNLQLGDGSSVKNSVSASLKFDVATTGGPNTTLAYRDKVQEKTSLVEWNHDIEQFEGCGKNIAVGNPEKKCQAIKLAYKLRGQWLAWKLAGLFLDGATSQISGFGYSKLPHETACLVNQ